MVAGMGDTLDVIENVCFPPPSGNGGSYCRLYIFVCATLETAKPDSFATSAFLCPVLLVSSGVDCSFLTGVWFYPFTKLLHFSTPALDNQWPHFNLPCNKLLKLALLPYLFPTD